MTRLERLTAIHKFFVTHKLMMHPQEGKLVVRGPYDTRLKAERYLVQAHGFLPGSHRLWFSLYDTPACLLPEEKEPDECLTDELSQPNTSETSNAASE